MEQVTTQKRNGVLVKVILCGGDLALMSVNGYSGCNGTGRYTQGSYDTGFRLPKDGFESKPPSQVCFRCEGYGYQSKEQYYRNKAYDRRAEERLAKDIIREAKGGG
tara:strand:- start:2122 stop:2439 length:318 start_codon:yes stop_codon:yes gene_type:complete